MYIYTTSPQLRNSMGEEQGSQVRFISYFIFNLIISWIM